MEHAIAAFPLVIYPFFFGLIAASAVVLYETVTVRSKQTVAAGVLGFTLAFLLSGVTGGAQAPHNMAIIFGAGAVAITAMVLPGISGAFLLLLLGQYQYLLGTLNRFIDLGVAVALGREPITALLEPSLTVGAFGVGALIGVVTIAHVVRWALAHYRQATLAFLVSLMVGALRLPVEKVVAVWVTPSVVTVGSILGGVAVGAGAVFVLDYYTDDLVY
jgi:putative membrane protein